MQKVAWSLQTQGADFYSRLTDMLLGFDVSAL